MTDAPTCGLCRFYQVDPADVRRGECRRYPPVSVPAIVNGQPVTQSRFPFVLPLAWWCGEWAPKITAGN